MTSRSNWPTQLKVRLAVTKFRPDDKPVAGLTDEQRMAHRERRKAECAKVEPAIDLHEVKHPANIWLYGNFVELADARPDPADCVPDPPKPRQPYDELWIKQRRQSHGI